MMKAWVRTLLLVLLLAVPTIVVGAVSPGRGATVVLVTGVLMLAVGVGIAVATARRGNRAEQEEDERQQLILARAMRTSFVLTALAIQLVWALEFAGRDLGPAGINAVHYVFWFSFMAAYGYNTTKI